MTEKIRHLSNVIRGAFGLLTVALAGVVLLIPANAPASAYPGPERSGQETQLQAAQIDGDWDLTIVTASTNVTGTLNLTVAGEDVQGSWTRFDGPGFPEESVTGKVYETTVELAFIVEINGVRDQVLFVGQVTGSGDDATMAGTYTAMDGTTGEWTARRP